MALYVRCLVNTFNNEINICFFPSATLANELIYFYVTTFNYSLGWSFSSVEFCRVIAVIHSLLIL